MGIVPAQNRKPPNANGLSGSRSASRENSIWEISPDPRPQIPHPKSHTLALS
ncbi:MAG: hypothetical protein F6J93_11295 [Oscillatoria sp. SIO1A7]|nr:hypothetical protein [Oscillatoria sp. SIO1A7]